MKRCLPIHSIRRFICFLLQNLDHFMSYTTFHWGDMDQTLGQSNTGQDIVQKREKEWNDVIDVYVAYAVSVSNL